MNKSPLQTVKDEVLEETDININGLKNDYLYNLGSYYANKNSIKKWHFYAVDVTSLKLNLMLTYFAKDDSSVGEKDISGTVVNEDNLYNVNDALWHWQFMENYDEIIW